MKRLPFLLFLVTLLGFPSLARADSFSLAASFGDLGITNQHTYSFDVSSVQTLALSLDGSTLTLTHHGNSNNTNGEVWLSTTSGGIQIGTLSESNGPSYFTDSWGLSPDVLTEITAQNPWKLTIKLGDITTGTDKITIRESTLSGTYTPTIQTSQVPEPPASVLLAGGALGIGLLRRRLR